LEGFPSRRLTQTKDAEATFITTNVEYRRNVLLTKSPSFCPPPTPNDSFLHHRVHVHHTRPGTHTLTLSRKGNKKRSENSQRTALQAELSKYKRVGVDEEVHYKNVTFEDLRAQLHRFMKARNPDLQPFDEECNTTTS
jgi:hypothetical protein